MRQRHSIPLPRCAAQAANRGLQDMHELVELVHECDRDYVWSQLETWGPTRVAVVAIFLAAAVDRDESITERLDWVRDLPVMMNGAA